MVKHNRDDGLPSSHNRGENIDNNAETLYNMALSNCQLLSVEQVAKMLGVSRSTIYKYLNTKLLPAIKIASRTMIKLADLKVFLESRNTYEGECNEI